MSANAESSFYGNRNFAPFAPPGAGSKGDTILRFRADDGVTFTGVEPLVVGFFGPTRAPWRAVPTRGVRSNREWCQQQRTASIDVRRCICSTEQVHASQLQSALKNLSEAIRETAAIVEAMRADSDPLAAHIFVSRRQYRNMPDTKSGSRREIAARLSWQTACELVKAFLPLSEQPLIYSLIRPDPTYVPTNQKQTFRDANGDLLAPGEGAFDLAPMAKRSEANGVHTIEFVDFTLDGSMNPNTVYFYFARELGNRMQLGEASPTFGPVKLVNLSPPSAPKLRKISTVPYDVLTGHNPEVRFEVVVPSSTDPVTRLRIYRAGAPVDALTLRTMAPVKETTTLVPTADETFIVADDFSSDPVVPYGEPIFYRLAWVRDVFYEDELGAPQTAAVISEPTQTLLANLIDIVNPTAPVPVLHLLATTSAGEKLVRMSWSKATHNGTYYVSRLDPSGNWVRLTSFKTNDDLVTFDLPDALPVDNEDGEKIYYRFKIDVENSSGLLNRSDSPITASLDSI